MTDDENYYTKVFRYAIYTAEGRITIVREEAMCFIDLRRKAGTVLVIQEGDYGWDDSYVDLMQTSAPLIKPRPIAPWVFNKQILVPMEEAIMNNVPPASVTFFGTSTGVQVHDKLEDLKIGWAMPGNYTVVIEAFPYKPLILDIIVQGPTGNTITD